MKLLVVLLTVGLSAPEKLDRTYLPPLGAKSAGGSSEELQIPLEYRDGDLTETSISSSENNGDSHFEETDAWSSEFANGSQNVDTGFEIETTHDNEVLPTTYEITNSYIQVSGPPNNIFKAVTPEMEYNVGEIHGFHENSENTALTYNNQSRNHVNYLLDDLYTSDVSYGNDSLNPDHSVTYLTPDRSNLPKTHNMPTIEIDSNQRSPARKTYNQRPARPKVKSDKNAVILNYKNSLTADSFSYSFDTSNGIHKDESATTVDGIKALGSYSYTGDDGKTYYIVYSADENGFQPKGDHLPTPPPIPEAIQKVIEQANKDKIAGTFNDGFYDEEKYGHMKYQGPVNRYLQKMQGIYKLKSRNKIMKQKKSSRKHELINDKNAKKHEVNEKNSQRYEYTNAPESPVNNLNGQFGIRKKSRVEQAVLPVGIKHGHKRKFAITNEVISGNRNQRMRPSLDYTMTTPQDAGYYYVPPIKGFIESVFQPTEEFDKTDEDVEAKSVPPEFYYINHQDHLNKPLEKIFAKIDSYFSNTEEPNSSNEIYRNNVYESTTQDVSQSINDFEIASISPLSEIKVTSTVQELYEDTLSTNSYDQENTKSNNHQEDSASNISRYQEQNENKLFTTPMPSQTNYTRIDNNSNIYETSHFVTSFVTQNSDASYLENEGYFKTTPKVPASFENFVSSTFTPNTIFTVDESQTEPTPNIKVDGFGRPFQDSLQQFNANKPIYEYFTPGKLSQDEKSTEIPQFTSTYFSYEEKLADNSKYDKLVTKVFDNRESEAEKTTDAEDFSGPKQPQRYDPETGYFY